MMHVRQCWLTQLSPVSTQHCMLTQLSPVSTQHCMLKDECPVDALDACFYIYFPYIFKNNGKFRRKYHYEY